MKKILFLLCLSLLCMVCFGCDDVNKVKNQTSDLNVNDEQNTAAIIDDNETYKNNLIMFDYYGGESRHAISLDYLARIENNYIVLDLYFGVFEDSIDSYLSRKPVDWEIILYYFDNDFSEIKKLRKISLSDINFSDAYVTIADDKLVYNHSITVDISFESLSNCNCSAIAMLLKNSIDNSIDYYEDLIYSKQDFLSVSNTMVYKLFQINCDNDIYTLNRDVDWKKFARGWKDQ